MVTQEKPRVILPILDLKGADWKGGGTCSFPYTFRPIYRHGCCPTSTTNLHKSVPPLLKPEGSIPRPLRTGHRIRFRI